MNAIKQFCRYLQTIFIVAQKANEARKDPEKFIEMCTCAFPLSRVDAEKILQACNFNTKRAVKAMENSIIGIKTEAILRFIEKGKA